MSRTDLEFTFTQHAMLVAWGQFAQAIGLIRALEAIPLHQKTYTHCPQTKVLEFFVAILAGLPHLKDISRSAHPLDQDQAVARAWGQPAWADYSGVSRTLQELTLDEARQIVQVLETISQPFIDREVTLALRERGYLVYDGDLTGRPVSNTSTTYPNVRFGHMSDAVHLGYQAAMVSIHSPTYSRLWLSVTPHPGDTVSCTQAEALVLAAEAKSGVRPWRRTDLLQQRLQSLQAQEQALQASLTQSQQALEQAQGQLQETLVQVQYWQQIGGELEAIYRQKQRPERPHSRLAQARARLAVQQRRVPRREKAVTRVQKRLERHQVELAAWVAQRQTLEQRSTRFEQENTANPAPIRAIFRLDAGFGTPDNVTLLIEMGYEVYTKPYSHRVTTGLRRRVTTAMTWTPVGANAEMVAWASIWVGKYPYPLDVALERFYTGQTMRYSTLLHYGQDPVTSDLPGWFHTYNARQTIEAGIKEGKQVFRMHFLKVRSEAAIFLQEHFATFAANSVRWATYWLREQCSQVPTEEQRVSVAGVKEMVQVAAHTSAWVIWQQDGCLLRFTNHSVFAGTSLQVSNGWAFQLPLPLFKSWDFAPI
jgi:hypothetical protein